MALDKTRWCCVYFPKLKGKAGVLKKPARMSAVWHHGGDGGGIGVSTVFTNKKGATPRITVASMQLHTVNELITPPPTAMVLYHS